MFLLAYVRRGGSAGLYIRPSITSWGCQPQKGEMIVTKQMVLNDISLFVYTHCNRRVLLQEIFLRAESVLL